MKNIILPREVESLISANIEADKAIVNLVKMIYETGDEKKINKVREWFKKIGREEYLPTT